MSPVRRKHALSVKTFVHLYRCWLSIKSLQFSGKSSEISDAGLNNELLSRQKVFDSDLVNLMSDFINRLTKPVCFLAHYGEHFDFPLLMSELTRANSALPEDTLWADTMQAFMDLDEPPQSDDNFSVIKEDGDAQSSVADDKACQGNDTSRPAKIRKIAMSYKLKEVYTRCFGEAPPVLHRAEDDCLTLLKVVKKFSPEFVKWADKRARNLREIRPMY